MSVQHVSGVGFQGARRSAIVPGYMSLHNQMPPHGPHATPFEHAGNVELRPVKLTGTLAFTFETRFPQRVTKYAAQSPTRQDDWID